jgi:hypothetical protein
MLDFGGQRGEFGGGAGDEDEVEAFLSELDGVFFANSVGGACDYCPGAFGTIFANLFLSLVSWAGRVGG